ncbi:threonyl-tRNA synthetase [Tepidanaerobacter acetatoxydans Re1]|uniref:Threonine--tRNA ligase n=1 Tax=Tepidanaerobacter acetatoxydans (strain DSM 21804 / JCM 16047 / Re1) TaxID=1209989 RepID=F4LW80_TEPAE|nr:threonine--tRNA ligase [Tepidanaerobacter acetatoxydans]AEE90856.1 threonyl-tRNA synthetase [Tepidanaerobacter acetatoxydans Re1]CDI40467.1 threonyl-tRNA synthetase [Tepidanaerobacter acetatoxydans Re1]
MEQVKVSLKDGVEKVYQKGITLLEIAENISRKLGKEALAAKVDGAIKDLSSKVDKDCNVKFLTFEDEEGRKVFWHSSSHVMAQAVKRLFPETKLAIGPAIDEGFYYDFDRDESFTPSDLEKIEQEMAKIIAEDYAFCRKNVSKEEAIEELNKINEPYKVELVEALPEGAPISFYQQGEFKDLCAGPHIPSTGRIKAFKLTSLAGAYWRGDEHNKMLQRIYGISFPKKSMLDEYLTRIEEAKRRDHRKLGKELDLFSIHEEGPGFPFFHPKGMIIWNLLTDFWRKEHSKRGYQEIKTPIILNEELWRRSGHWDHYKENMYFTKIDDMNYAVKPMNCPGGILMYKTDSRSYRDLPIRLGELGLVHRHELSGVLHGLMRVRCFTQDDAHIFMMPSQIEDEIIGVIDLVDYFYQIFGFEYNVELSTRPENSMGSDELWDQATAALQGALDKKGMSYKINEGDGAFYGPKIDFHLKDSLGRTWQCGTIQLDFQMPERFDLSYIGADGEKHRPVMIHRVIFGSIERFIGILIEHYAGAFPVWLAPVQARVLPISEKHMDYAYKVKKQLEEAGIRVEVDERNEKIGYKVRDAQMKKIPYMLIVGDKEANENTVSVRTREKGDVGQKPIETFIDEVLILTSKFN